jgi:hypothetical protein
LVLQPTKPGGGVFVGGGGALVKAKGSFVEGGGNCVEGGDCVEGGGRMSAQAPIKKAPSNGKILNFMA